jgi:hypothetical protein
MMMLAGTAHASVIVVGDGTPASCTASAFQDALTTAAAPSPEYTIIRFECGDEPLKIVMPDEPRVAIPDRTTIDGADRVTLQGAFLVAADSSVALVRLGLRNGLPGGVAIRNSGTLDVRGSVFADGTGPSIDNRGGTVTLSDTVVTGGRVDTGNMIFSFGTLRVDHSLFENNRPTNAHTIQNIGVTEIKNSIFRNNKSESGSIVLSGEATIQNCEFTGNSGFWGGAIGNGASLTIKNSTFAGNDGSWGSSIANDGSLEIDGSEFYDNRAGFGGAIFNCRGSLAMTNSMVMRNRGSGIWTPREIELKHTTVADNLPDDISMRPIPVPYVRCEP